MKNHDFNCDVNQRDLNRTTLPDSNLNRSVFIVFIMLLSTALPNGEVGQIGKGGRLLTYCWGAKTMKSEN